MASEAGNKKSDVGCCTRGTVIRASALLTLVGSNVGAHRRHDKGNIVSIQGRGEQIEYVEKPPGNDSESSSRPL